MAAAQDVHVRICNQEIVRFDLEVKALIQVLIPGTLGPAVLTQSSTVSLQSFPRSVGSPRSLALPHDLPTSLLTPSVPSP